MKKYQEKIAIVGLGYVGLPVAVAFAEKFETVLGFDINLKRISSLKKGQDDTGEVERERLLKSSIEFSGEISDLKGYDYYIVAVPTPVDSNKRPDLRGLVSASRMLGEVLAEGATVVFESTVYPGVTEQICGVEIEKVSGLKQGEGFFLGYSPERINPGDKEHTIDKIIKVVSGDSPSTLDKVDSIYSKIITAGTHRASSIQVAEAAKVIENTQRDLNIALMNELSIIFDKLDIKTSDVLRAASSKWNFLPFTPGLVGGHCIGVDPYYLTAKAEELGYTPEIILAGRRINDSMANFIAQKIVKLMSGKGLKLSEANIGVLGLTFKEDISDIRNSKVFDLIRELKDYGLNCLSHDPLADKEEVLKEYSLNINTIESFENLDALILAVNHSYYSDKTADIIKSIKKDGIFIDVKSQFSKSYLESFGRDDIVYWSL